MTHAERRAYLMWILGTPQMAQSLSVAHPRNIAKNQALLGLSDYYADGVDDHYKAQEIIPELLKAQPIKAPLPDGSMSMQPSIPIDDFDDHAIMAQEAYAWAKATSGRREQKDNPGGFANVIAWGAAHMKANQPPPAPMPPPKLSISAKVGDLQPDQAQAVLSDFNVNVPPAQGALPPNLPLHAAAQPAVGPANASNGPSGGPPKPIPPPPVPPNTPTSPAMAPPTMPGTMGLPVQ